MAGREAGRRERGRASEMFTRDYQNSSAFVT